MSIRIRSIVTGGNATRVAAAVCGLALAVVAAAAQSRADTPAPEGAPAPTHAGPPPGGPGAGGPAPDGVPPFLRGIDLTEAQRDKIFALTHAQAPAVREQFKALEKAQRDLRTLVFQGPFDEAKAHALAETAGHAQSELAIARARTDAQILQLLTPAQRKQLDEARPEAGGPDGHPGQGPGREHKPSAPPRS